MIRADAGRCPGIAFYEYSNAARTIVELLAGSIPEDGTLRLKLEVIAEGYHEQPS